MKVICHARFSNEWYASLLNLTNLYFVNVLRKNSKFIENTTLWMCFEIPIIFFHVFRCLHWRVKMPTIQVYYQQVFSIHYWDFLKWVDDCMLIIACDHIYVCQLMLCDLLLLMAFALLHFHSASTNIDLHLPPLK